MRGQLLQPVWQGPDWMTGGPAGPEGSVVVMAALAFAAFSVVRWWRAPRVAAT